MRIFKIKYASAKNFLPFGPKGIELDFSKYKNIVLIRGVNKDAKLIDKTDNELDNTSDNGVGKSSIQEIISYGLYGKTIKRPEKVGVNDVVHNKIGKDCCVEILFDNFRVVRTRKDGGNKDKHSLRLWESEKGIWDKDTEITQGTESATQKKIEEKIGLSYDSFVNICVFTDDQRVCFLECDNTKKREIVENLLSLEDYRLWHENAKSAKKEIKSKIDLKAKEYQLLLSNKEDAERRLNLSEEKQKNWKTTKEKEIASIEEEIISKKKQLSETDNGAALLEFQKAQEIIKKINEKFPIIENSKKDLIEQLDVLKTKEDAYKLSAQDLTKEYNDFSSQAKIKLSSRKEKETEIENLSSNVPGTKCDKCKGLIEEENINSYIQKLQIEINDINVELEKIVNLNKEVANKAKELKEKQQSVSKEIKEIDEKISNIEIESKKYMAALTKASQVKEPKASSAEFLLEQKCLDLEKQIENKKEELFGISPFQEIIDNDKLELKKISENVLLKEKEVKELELQIPYYDYWISGFGEKGIRKWVVDGIIPELNNRIYYWLQFLIDNKFTIKFDNQLNEKIERSPVDGDPYVYHAMSTGQRRRLNLAVSQAFAHIMTLSSGAIPSIVFLDEVSTNVDPSGVQGIYNMILELSENKQVFVTTHDQDLLRMLQGSDVINLVHEAGFTELIA